jgi:hypothetical protein
MQQGAIDDDRAEGRIGGCSGVCDSRIHGAGVSYIHEESHDIVNSKPTCYTSDAERFSGDHCRRQPIGLGTHHLIITTLTVSDCH